MSRRVDADIHHVGIFGRRLSGKTTLAREILLACWREQRWRALVLDPNFEAWGAHAWVTTDREAWLRKLWASRNCNVAADEAGMTIKRDRELTDLFTRVGHQGHRLFIMGHSGSNLLPTMREQLTEIFLFRQSRNEAETWAELFADERIMDACNLDFSRREFLHARLGGNVRRGVLRLSRRQG